jgi:hypothetical protein
MSGQALLRALQSGANTTGLSFERSVVELNGVNLTEVDVNSLQGKEGRWALTTPCSLLVLIFVACVMAMTCDLGFVS